MKYSVCILDSNNIPLGDDIELTRSDIELTSSAAEYFAGCVYLAVELLNGGHNIQKLIPKFTIEPELAPKMAFVMFLYFLHKHPSFDATKILLETDPNVRVYQNIEMLLHVPADQGHAEFLQVISNFKVPGIKVIMFTVPELKGPQMSRPLPSQDVPLDSKYATQSQPYGPYSDRYCFPPSTFFKKPATNDAATGESAAMTNKR